MLHFSTIFLIEEVNIFNHTPPPIFHHQNFQQWHLKKKQVLGGMKCIHNRLLCSVFLSNILFYLLIFLVRLENDIELTERLLEIPV